MALSYIVRFFCKLHQWIRWSKPVLALQLSQWASHAPGNKLHTQLLKSAEKMLNINKKHQPEKCFTWFRKITLLWKRLFLAQLLHWFKMLLIIVREVKWEFITDGQMIRPYGPSFLTNGMRFSCSRQNIISGKTKTIVFPEPVNAMPIMSRPDNLKMDDNAMKDKPVFIIQRL